MTFDRQILTFIGLRQATLAVNTLGRHGTNTGTQLQTGRNGGLLGRLSTGLAQGLIKQIFKHRTLAFETVGAHVCQVIGDDIHVGLLCFKTCFGNP